MLCLQRLIGQLVATLSHSQWLSHFWNCQRRCPNRRGSLFSLAVDQRRSARAVTWPKAVMPCPAPSFSAPFSAFPAHAYHFNSARLLYTETHTAEQADRYINALIDGILGVRKLPMATIAAINGSSFGAGVELSLACDIRVAAAEATLCFPETSLGIFPGAAGAVLCPRIIGVARAKELIFTARRFSGVEAKEWGVVQHCTSPGGDAYADALELGIKIASNGPLGVRGAKLVMDAMDDSLTFDEQLKLSNDHRFPLNDTEDFKEALKAFSEKRKPVFKGK